jgi:hypothetical protein
VRLALGRHQLIFTALREHIDRAQLIACDPVPVLDGHARDQVLDGIAALAAGFEVNVVHDVAVANHEIDPRRQGDVSINFRVMKRERKFLLDFDDFCARRKRGQSRVDVRQDHRHVLGPEDFSRLGWIALAANVAIDAGLVAFRHQAVAPVAEDFGQRLMGYAANCQRGPEDEGHLDVADVPELELVRAAVIRVDRGRG